MDYTLITGGNGYIGSHICNELCKSNNNIILLDNLENSSLDSYKRLKNSCVFDNIILENIDLMDKTSVDTIFKKYSIKNVIHLAGLKSVDESLQLPLLYHNTNITGTLNLLNVMDKYKCYNLIFSSSATVYGFQKNVPIKETSIIDSNLKNPYAKTKLYIESILSDLYNSNNNWNIIVLRYFNPVANDSSGLIWEDPIKKASNLFPIMIDVLEGRKDKVIIFGNDYGTRDGTCIRDFIHVTDLAVAHIKSLKFIENKKGYFDIFNIGTGKGYSVLEIITKFNTYTNNKIPYLIGARREGDIEFSFGDPSKANKILNWYPTKDIDDMIKDTLSRFK